MAAPFPSRFHSARCPDHRSPTWVASPREIHRLLLLADGEMFGRHAQQERRRRKSLLDPAAILRDLTALSPGRAGGA